MIRSNTHVHDVFLKIKIIITYQDDNRLQLPAISSAIIAYSRQLDNPR